MRAPHCTRLRCAFIFLCICAIVLFTVDVEDLIALSNHALQSPLNTKSSSVVLLSKDNLMDRWKDLDLSVHIMPTSVETALINAGIFLSREYQMKLRHPWVAPRSTAVPILQERLSIVLDLPELIEPGLESTRGQWTLSTKACGKMRNVRQRTYIDGYRGNTTTVDIKSSGDRGDDEQADISMQPFLQADPSALKRGDVERKFELDLHPCHIKWSSETRVYNLSGDYWFGNCYQCNELFPKCFSEAHIEEHGMDETEIVLESWWWELEHHGYTKLGSKYKTSLTVSYFNLEDARLGEVKPAFTTEWSIRLYADNDGLGPWRREVLRDMDRKYSQILDFINTPDLPCKDGEVRFVPGNYTEGEDREGLPAHVHTGWT